MAHAHWHCKTPLAASNRANIANSLSGQFVTSMKLAIILVSTRYSLYWSHRKLCRWSGCRFSASNYVSRKTFHVSHFPLIYVEVLFLLQCMCKASQPERINFDDEDRR